MQRNRLSGETICCSMRRIPSLGTPGRASARGGGRPLTMFLTPLTQEPIFGGTYFPKRAQHGLPAFRDLLLRVADYYREHRAEIAAQGLELRAAFARRRALRELRCRFPEP